jgi:predicted nucleic acid-binding protein
VKVLVDTCVWSLSLRRRKGTAGLTAEEQRLVNALTEAIRDGRVAMVGPIRQELLSGIRDAAQFEKLRSTLDACPNEPITSDIYVEAARLDNLCRARRVQCGEVNMLLCAVAAHYGWMILTSDEGLLRCMKVVDSERKGERRPREHTE